MPPALSAFPKGVEGPVGGAPFLGLRLGIPMGVTFLFGYCSARIYRRYRNLYFLGMAHATVGFLLFLVVPDSISRHLKVGPAWFKR